MTEDERRMAALFNDITRVDTTGHLRLSDRVKIRDYLWAQGWRRDVRPEDVTEAAEAFQQGGMIQTYPNICSSGVGGGEVCMRRKGHDGDHDPDSTEVRL